MSILLKKVILMCFIFPFNGVKRRKRNYFETQKPEMFDF